MEHTVQLAQFNVMSLESGSKAFNILPSTQEHKVIEQSVVRPKSEAFLTLEEEDELVKWIRLSGENFMMRSPCDVRDKAKEILQLKGVLSTGDDTWPKRGWVARFRKRHPEISQFLLRNSRQDFRHWLVNMKDYLDAVDPDLLRSPARLFNVNQIGFSVCQDSKRILAPLKRRWKSPSSDDKEHQLTVLCSASAAGELVEPSIIYPVKSAPQRDLGSFFQISPNGRINANVFESWLLHVFVPFVEKMKKPVVLYVTRHVASLNSIKICNQHGIMLLGLPWYRLQSLDRTVLPVVRAVWRYLDSTGESVCISNFAQLLKSTWDSCATPEAIREGFRRSGIFPFDPRKPFIPCKWETLARTSTPCKRETLASIPSPCKMETLASIQSPWETETSTSIPSPYKIEPLTSILNPCKTETLTSIPAPCKTETLASISNPYKTETLASIPNPCKLETLTSIASPCKTEILTSIPSPCKTEILTSIRSPCKTETLTSIPAPSATSCLNLMAENPAPISMHSATSLSQCTHSSSRSLAWPIPAVCTSDNLSTSKLDHIAYLVRLSHEVGLEKSENFLKDIRDKKCCLEDWDTFMEFKETVMAICCDKKLNTVRGHE